MSSIRRGIGIVVVAALSVGAVRADVLVEYADATPACHGEFRSLAISGVRMRVEPPGEDYAMIYDGAEKLAVMLDAKGRRYFELELDEDALDYQSDVLSSTSTMVDKKLSKAMGGNGASARGGTDAMAAAGVTPEQLAGMQAMLQQNLANLPADQREQMERAMKDMQGQGLAGMTAGAQAMAPRAPEIVRSGETAKVGGIVCAKQSVRQDGELMYEECVAEFDALGLEPAELARLLKSLRSFDGLANAWSKFHVMGVSMPAHEPAERKGVAVERRCFARGREVGSTTLKLSRPQLSDASFEIPAGYQRMEMGGPMGGDAR